MESDDFPIDPEALTRAEAAVAALSRNYLTWARADLESLGAALDELHDGGGAAWTARAARVFAIAHDIKGQAGTFGYPLLTCLANAVCRLLERHAAFDSDALARTDELVAAMGLVLAEGLAGDGGARGLALLDRLEVQGGDFLPGS